ncbi:SIR2 family NAD-dependent protein deacylase [Burkholderia gladioli]|uniref:SIR2 family NAD-dependent protein deacylase n=1 Tax=Burkholderia gladioli TaxID=28095 RepID=UPI00163E231E|nr:SIR2 family protein [Burkholderia gladioli]
MAFDPKKIPDALRQAYGAGRCAVLVGAGASKGAGLPLWGELLTKMIDSAVAHGVVAPAKEAEYRELARRTDKFLMVASGLKDDLRSHFDQFIEETFIAPKPTPTALHEALVALDKLQFVLTTNYDTLLERAFRKRDDDVSVCSFTDAGEVQRRLSRREFFILKAHGDATKLGNKIVLTDVDYRNLLFGQRAYQSLLSAMFTMFTIIFVGASMTDPEISLLLSYIADSFSPNAGPTHYALMAAEDVTEVEKNRWFKDFKIQLITVSKQNDYAELTEFLRELGSSPIVTPAVP